MHQIRNEKAPAIFQEKFNRPNHQYLTNHWHHNFVIPSKPLKLSCFGISPRDPYLLNRCVTKFDREITNFLHFKNKTKYLFLASKIRNFTLSKGCSSAKSL